MAAKSLPVYRGSTILSQVSFFLPRRLYSALFSLSLCRPLKTTVKVYKSDREGREQSIFRAAAIFLSRWRRRCGLREKLRVSSSPLLYTSLLARRSPETECSPPLLFLFRVVRSLSASIPLLRRPPPPPPPRFRSLPPFSLGMYTNAGGGSGMGEIERRQDKGTPTRDSVAKTIDKS